MTIKRFGTFEGVFTPTLLSILGVIMYLRLGWVVGNAGLGRALIIILLANFITIITTLSISSIITNIKIGSGGAYSIISKSLGLEMGGAIGIPLYISQAVSIAFYITGFVELWTTMFPTHSFIFISILTWTSLLIISYTSARLAFRLQYGIMAIIGLSLISIFLGQHTFSQNISFWSGLGKISFWKIFAVFFPAVTGILAGVSMSGELKKPTRSIPLGTFSAIFVSLGIYILLTFWFAHNASLETLVKNTAIIIELARWKLAVIIGIMGATLSSALSMFVASPRTLFALGRYKIIPFSSFFSKTNKKGEPANAIFFTAALTFVTLLLGSLNTIAGLLTMFFLITYGMINMSVLIEQGIGITSFRPSFRVPIIFPLLGTIGCILFMFLINPIFSIIAIIIILFVYTLLIKKESKRNWPDVRKGIFVFLAERAIKIASKLPYYPKIWKPSMLIPIKKPKEWIESLSLLKAIASPSGRIYFLNIIENKNIERSIKNKKVYKAHLTKLKRKYEQEFLEVTEDLTKKGILVSFMVIESPELVTGVGITIQALKSTALPPNILFIKLSQKKKRDKYIKSMIEKAQAESLGIIIAYFYPQTVFEKNKTINLWIRSKSANVNLAVLVALQIIKSWKGKLRLIRVVQNGNNKKEIKSYLYRLKQKMRMPQNTEIKLVEGNFEEALKKAPVADINIFGMAAKQNLSKIRKICKKIRSHVLFIKDSEQESATA